MPNYRYSALDKNGLTVTGEITADDRPNAIATLTGRHVFVTDIAEGTPRGGTGRSTAWRLPGRRRLGLRAKAAVLRQLATALQAGLPLLSALRVVEEQADTSALRGLISDLADRVKAGEALSQAMQAHPREFSRLEVSMASVGETVGLLDQIMGYLSDFAERDVEIREKVRSAAAYPVFVLALACVSVVIVLAVVLPRVLGTVTATVTALPWPTRVLMGLSQLVASYGWLMLIVLAGAVWGFRTWLAWPRGRLAFDRFKLRIPVLGTALRRIAVARFARTLGTLSKSGVQILEALHVLRDTLGNEALSRRIDEAAASIRQGESIAEPLRLTGEFPPLLIQVIAMGERTGRLDQLLLQTAEAYEKETANAVGRVMAVLPAVFIVLLALVVLFVLSAVLLPIIEMETSVPGM
ncbi:MAG: hypothetical protein AMJ81_09685 [Phycisphaerae bacterium SM23_33]|jgi:general secretion pathway protein F|nr:MAG: hypothetical protein AMJ81_09685 [Phycisphaerae bacterium SM23_33]